MRALICTMVVVVLDQLSKYLVRLKLDLHAPRAILGDFFRFTYVENSGIAFGIGVGGALPVFTALSVLAIGLILYYLYHERANHLAVRLSLALVLGGAIGNLIDRVAYGRVVDFLDFGLGAYRFYVFNLADTAVTMGVGIYLFLTMFLGPHKQAGEVESV